MTLPLDIYNPDLFVVEDADAFRAAHFGERLGGGLSRLVFVLKDNPEFVIKWEDPRQGRFQNVREFCLWDYARWMFEAARWLAPISGISQCGNFLIMRRTRPCTECDMPDKVPIWMTDLKTPNFGWFDGRVVQHDYATTLLANGASNRRMKKAVLLEPVMMAMPHAEFQREALAHV